MLSNNERKKIKSLELSGDANNWIKDESSNHDLKKYQPQKWRVAQKVRDIRGERTMSEFGDLIGVSHSSVSFYENQLTIPSNKVIIKIIKLPEARGMTHEEFLYGYPLEYLQDIFGQIKNLLDDDRADFYPTMTQFLNENPDYYGFEDNLIYQAMTFYASLKYSPDYILLARLYGIEKQNVHLLNFNDNKYEQAKNPNYRYEVETRADFHMYIMPLLEKYEHVFVDTDIEEVVDRLRLELEFLFYLQEKERGKNVK